MHTTVTITSTNIPFRVEKRMPSFLFSWTPMASYPNKELKYNCSYIYLLQ